MFDVFIKMKYFRVVVIFINIHICRIQVQRVIFDLCPQNLTYLDQID